MFNVGRLWIDYSIDSKVYVVEKATFVDWLAVAWSTPVLPNQKVCMHEVYWFHGLIDTHEQGLVMQAAERL